MKQKTKLILILAPIIIILILVIIKSLDKNTFNLTAKETLDLSLEPGHILSINELKTLRNADNILILDLREASDFKANHLSNARNIPFQFILQRADNEKDIKESNKTVLYSDSIEKTTKAWTLLTQMGYRNLYILDIPGDLISENIFEKDTVIPGDEVLKYKFRPDSLIEPESIN